MKNLLYILLLCMCFGAMAQQKNFEFSKNIGQIVDQNGNNNDEVLFLGIQPSVNVQIKKDGFSYDTNKETYAIHTDEDGEKTSYISKIAFDRVDFTFQNTTGSTSFDYEDINGEHYFQGSDAKTKFENTQRILQKEVYSNIDVEYLFDNQAFKYNLIVKEGANISDISIKIDSENNPKLVNGNLEIATKNGIISESIPSSFYNKNNKEIKVRYKLEGNIISFESEEDFNGSAFTIDPIGTLNRTWGTYFGGERNDEVKSSDLDDEGNVYITGLTNSTMSIASSGAYHTDYDGTEASISYLGTAYIAKMGQDGQLVWASYYGAVGVENSSVFSDIVIYNGQIYVTGSTDPNFAIVNPTQFATHQGGTGEGDIVLMTLDLDGNPIWSTYLGGDDREKARAMDVDASGIYLTGFVKTPGLATPGVSQTVHGGGNDGFVAKVSLAGFLEWFTYVGDTGSDFANSLTLKDNSLIIAGATYSDNFTTTPGVFQTARAGSSDMYIIEMGLTGQINKSTFLGGDTGENYYHKKVSFLDDNIVFALKTQITTVNTAGNFNENPTDIDDSQSLLCIMNADLNAVEGTWIGDATTTYMADETYCVLVDSDKSIWVGGITKFQTGITTADGHTTTQPIPALACEDGFISKYSTDLSQLLYGSYIANGGPASGQMQNNGGEKVSNIHEYNNTLIITGDIYGSGSQGINYGVGPIATAGAHDTNFEAQGSNSGRFEGFIMAFCADDWHANIDPSQIYEACPGTTIDVTPFESYVLTGWTGLEMSADFIPSFGTSGNYTLTTTDEFGCTSDTTFTLTFNGTEVEILIADPNLGSIVSVEADENTTIQLEIQSGFNTVLWTSNGGIDCDNCDQTSYAVTAEDEIIVEVEDAIGCITSDTLQITISEILEPVNPVDPINPIPGELDTLTLQIPQGFSPNGDGINDLFEIKGISSLEVNVKIWNRWGGIVYTDTNYKNDWDATCKGSGCLGDGSVPEGTYFYSITKGETNYQGYITIKK